jgi:hypothetical protein
MPTIMALTDTPPELSPKVVDTLRLIPDDAFRAEVTGAVSRALLALGELSRIHLPQDHFEEGEMSRAADDKYVDLAPYFLGALASVNQLLTYIGETFPPPAAKADAPSDDDFDLEFDLVDGPTGEGVGLTKARVLEQPLTPREQVADAVYAFGGMLRSRETELAQRLRYALKQADRWPLLSELDDGQHKLVKAVQGLLFGVLGVFASDVRREEILPSYRSAIRESVALRAALTELTFHINRFNAALADATPEILVPLIVAVNDRLNRFSVLRSYRTLRAEDKKAVIDFRSTLYNLRHNKDGVAMTPLKLAVEGFSKFLEAMSAINHREVLILHDRQRLSASLDRLRSAKDGAVEDPEGAVIALAAMVTELAAVLGRNPDIDQARRVFHPMKIEPENILEEIARWQRLLEGALTTVG